MDVWKTHQSLLYSFCGKDPNFPFLLAEVRPPPWNRLLSRPVAREALRLSTVRFLGQAAVLDFPKQTRNLHERSAGFYGGGLGGTAGVYLRFPEILNRMQPP